MNPLKFLRVEWQLQSIAVGFLLIGLRRQKHNGVDQFGFPRVSPEDRPKQRRDLVGRFASFRSLILNRNGPCELPPRSNFVDRGSVQLDLSAEDSDA